MLLVGTLALGMTQFAKATTYSGNAANTTYTYITGSTANGCAVHKAILDLLGNTAGNQFFGAAYTGSAGTTAPALGILGSKVAIYKGTINGAAVYIKLTLSGSELGLQQIKSPTALTVNFLDENLQTFGTTPITPSSGGYTAALAACTASAPTTDYDVHVSDAAFSDTFQANSRFNGRVRTTGGYVTYGQATPATITGGTGLALTDGVTGVVPFKFLANNGAPFSNVSSAQLLALYNSFPAKIKLSEFTGTTSDSTKFVYATGRDIDSGTRLNALGLIGLPYNNVVDQFQPQSGGAEVDAIDTTAGDITLVEFPAANVDLISEATGNSGYTSGGSLSKMMRSPAASFANSDFGALVSYAGVGDCDPQLAPNQITNPAKELSFNGVTLGGADAFAANFNAYNSNGSLINGVYTFWCYEHLYLNPTSVSGNSAGVAVANQIATQLYTTDAYVLLGSMKVTRTTDGTAINY